MFREIAPGPAVKAVEIVEFSPQYQQGVEDLVLPIQTIEFNVPITREEQPDLVYIKDTFQKGLGNFWVALCDGAVVGSVGIVDFGGRQVALKKMFVHRDFRGRDRGVAADLLACVIEWCNEKGIESIYLGTVTKLKAAQRFYEKNGFVEVAKSELPENFPLVAVDDKFYKRDLGRR